MSLMKTKSKASIKGTTPKGDNEKLENVFIISAELRERLLIMCGEMPRKYGNLLGPLEEGLVHAINIPEMEVTKTPIPPPDVPEAQPEKEDKKEG